MMKNGIDPKRSSASMATSEASFVASLVAVCAAYRSVSWKVLISAGLVYRVVQLNFTPEIEVFCMLLEVSFYFQ